MAVGTWRPSEARPSRFARVAKSFDVEFQPVRATWRWPRGSIASEVDAGLEPEVVESLASLAMKAAGAHLQRAM